MSARTTGRPSLSAGGAGLRDGLTPLAAGCISLVVGPKGTATGSDHIAVSPSFFVGSRGSDPISLFLSPLLALASLASAAAVA